MKVFKFVIVVLLIAGCQSKKNGLFKTLADQQAVTIVLKNYHLDSVPADVGELSKTETLTITYDSIGKSTSDTASSSPAAWRMLPKELTQLKKLKNLTLYKLNIKKLPDNFADLKNLEYLDLSMNKLTIADEMDKLKKLKDLKYLGILGNKIDTAAIMRWRKENPSLRIDIGLE